jgi:hypothetical protein
MSKRTKGTERREKDYYPTFDRRAALALAPHVAPGTRYVEPCAGGGDLIENLNTIGLECAYAFDLEPKAPGVHYGDAFKMRSTKGKIIITNPPWRRDWLHPMIRHFASVAPTWLMFDADWMHTAQAIDFAPITTDIVSVGRLQFLKKGEQGYKGHDALDNCAWYRFAHDKIQPTRFHFRTPKQGESSELEGRAVMAERSPS